VARYLEWVKSHLNGVFENEQEMNEKQVKAHFLFYDFFF